MGLDITAISNLEKKHKMDPKVKALSWQLRPKTQKTRIKIDVTPYEVKGGYNKCEDMEGGEYAETDLTEEHHFRAGSYGGYNTFRRLLSKGLAGVDPELIWATPDFYKDAQMFEIINFSDCEGILGTAVCKKLHPQFVENREKFETYLREGCTYDGNEVVWQMSTYDDFTEAFRLGAENGIVLYT